MFLRTCLNQDFPNKSKPRTWKKFESQIPANQPIGLWASQCLMSVPIVQRYLLTSAPTIIVFSLSRSRPDTATLPTLITWNRTYSEVQTLAEGKWKKECSHMDVIQAKIPMNAYKKSKFLGQINHPLSNKWHYLITDFNLPTTVCWSSSQNLKIFFDKFQMSVTRSTVQNCIQNCVLLWQNFKPAWHKYFDRNCFLREQGQHRVL